MIEEQAIPENWELTSLGEFIEDNGEFLTDGDWIEKDDMNKNGQIGIVQLGQIKRGELLFDDISKYITEEWAEKNNCTIAEYGDIVISRMSPVLGGAIVPEYAGDFVVPVDAMIARGLENPTREYLLHYLNSPYSIQFGEQMSKGATRTRVSQSDARELSVPVPPLDEQERIVEAVEERLKRVERLEKSVENVGRLVDEYQDSYLAYLVTGGDESAVENLGHRLTSEDVADNWEVKEVSEIVSAKNGGTPKRSKEQYWGGNIEWLSSGEVKGKYTNSAEENINQSAIEESSAKLFPENSVLVAMYGKTRGQTTMITGQMSGNQAICCLTPSEKILPEYLLYFYKSIEDRLASKGRGAGQQNLNQSMVVEEMMPLPPIEEQREIVSDIEKYNFSKVKKSSSVLSGHFDEYKDSILSHAFKGDLRRLTSSRSERVS
jgi:type I restriction enzyme S subunit